MYAMNQEMGTLEPIHEAIWNDEGLFDVVEKYLNTQARTIAYFESKKV